MPVERPRSRSLRGPKRGTLRAAFLLLAVLAAADPAPVAAQPAGFGIGAQVGAPGGVSMRLARRQGAGATPLVDAVTLNAAFTLDGYILVQGYATRTIPLRNSPLELFAGPGLSGGSDRGTAMGGLSAVAGARFYRGRFEVFLQAAPRVHVLPDFSGIMGAAVGLRYYP